MNIKKVLKLEAENLTKGNNVGNKQVSDYVISLKMADGHMHHVTPDNQQVANELIEDSISCSTLSMSPVEQKKEPPEKVVFHNRQAFGDILTMTAAVRDFKNSFPNTQVGVTTTAMHIWDHNPHIDHQFRDTKHQVNIGPGFLTNKSNYWNLHMCNAFRLDIENKMGLSFKQGPITPDIWMTEAEYKRFKDLIADGK